MKSFWQEFKTPLITIILLFLGFYLYTKLAGPIPFFINSVTTTKTDLFSTSGEATVTAAPDTATVNLGVTAQSSNAINAQNKANQTVQSVISALDKLGIPQNDIKTINYSLTPNYATGGIEPLIPVRGGGGGQNITGYSVDQNLEVKVTPLNNVNKVIDAATKNGANLIGGVSFTFSDSLKKSLEDKARLEAVDNAKSKAQSLANAAGIHLGNIVNVIETNNQPRIFPMMAQETQSVQPTQTPTNVTPGENTVTIDVTIYYETY